MPTVIFSTLEGLFHPDGTPARVQTHLVTVQDRVVEKMYDCASNDACEIQPAPAGFMPKKEVS